MSKQIIKNTIDESKSTSLVDLASKAIYTPTPRQRQVKARFWVRYVPSPLATLDSLSAATVQRITGTAGIKEWWSEPGFREWFLNREEAREKLEYLFMKALDAAEDILDDPNAQASAKVNMIKVLGELANKFPSKWQEKYSDEDINRMDEKQLKHYLEQRGVSISEEKVIDVQTENNDK